MRDRWLALCGPYDRSVAAAAFADLAARYEEPQRAYHVLAHIENVLDVLEELGGSTEEQFAAWWHDAVYDPRRSDNEARSAALAADWLGRLGALQPTIAEVERLILATAAHEPANDTGSAALIDADLAVLGAPPDEYERYRAAVRTEYGWLSDDEWVQGRRAVLETFLARQRIFTTRMLSERLEARARANIKGELSALCAARPPAGGAPARER